MPPCGCQAVLHGKAIVLRSCPGHWPEDSRDPVPLAGAVVRGLAGTGTQIRVFNVVAGRDENG